MSNSLQFQGLQASLSFTTSWSLLKLMSIESVVPSSDSLILCRPLSSCLQCFPASGSFPMSQPIESGDQYIGSSASDFPMNIQGWFPLELTGLISLLSQGFSSSPAPQFESINFWHAAFFMVQLSHLYMATRNIIVLTICTFISKVMSLLFNMLSRFVIAFLSRRRSF